MDLHIKEAIVDALTDMVNGKQPEMLDTGICYIIHHVIRDNSKHRHNPYIEAATEWKALMEATCRNWNKWTGSLSYPVPKSAEYCSDIDAARAFDNTSNKWDRETEYGANRLELAGLLLNAITDSGVDYREG